MGESTNPGRSPEYFGWGANMTKDLAHPALWLPALLFAFAQFVCVAITGDGLFGNLTGGVVESLRLVRTGGPMRWHLFGGGIMWALGVMQFVLKAFRHGRWAWIHRSIGKLFLCVWAFVVGPSAAYLSLFCGVGPANAQLTMMGFSVVSLDTTMFANYFFWRAWLVARRRSAGSSSLALHGKAMGVGVFFTMTIIFQRPLQFLGILVRQTMLNVAWNLPPWCSWIRWIADALASSVLDHHVILSLTTLIYAFPPFLVDGPRSSAVVWALGLQKGECAELFGSDVPSRCELLFWRLRVPFYVFLRAIVTRCWTADPAHP